MTASSRDSRVVILGGGFAGLYAARTLANKPVQVTLLDRKNHHTFQPLLYQVATAGLSPGEIAVPIRGIFGRHRNVEVLLGEATGFDLDAQQVFLAEGALEYEYLLVATGATHNYFGNDSWARFAPGLKTVEDATEIRRRVFLAFELAERQASLHDETRPVNFVVVGGGATGVELAGALVEIAHRVLAGDFRKINPAVTRVILVEAGPRILPAYPEDLSRSAEQQLRRLGVEVLTNTRVTGVTSDSVLLGDKVLPSAVTLWGAGVSASPLGRQLGAPLDRAGRVIVEPDLSIAGHPNVFVLGDLAAVTQADGKQVPGVAPAAIQMGEFAAKTILADLRGDVRRRFEYRDKGSLATIGRAAAIADLGRVHLTGFTAWLSWLFIHVFFLIGFHNRVAVLMEWAWAYVTFQRGARLITGNSESVTPPEIKPVQERKVS